MGGQRQESPYMAFWPANLAKLVPSKFWETLTQTKKEKKMTKKDTPIDFWNIYTYTYMHMHTNKINPMKFHAYHPVDNFPFIC